MAKTVYDSKTYALEDGTEVVLKPLSLGHLKKFMEAWGEFANIKEENDAFEIYTNVCGISLDKEVRRQKKFEKTLDPSTVLTEEYRTWLEDVLDMETIFEIIKICGGIDLDDPKLAEAAETAKAAAAAAGTN